MAEDHKSLSGEDKASEGVTVRDPLITNKQVMAVTVGDENASP